LNRGHNAAVDHWALGVLIYEMVTGENPFFYDGMPQMELFECIVRDKFFPLPDDVSDDAFHVIDGLLVKEPTTRLGSLSGRGKDIMAMTWFRELDLKALRQKKHPAPFIPKNDKLNDVTEGFSMRPTPEMKASLKESGLRLSTPSPLGTVPLMGTANHSDLCHDSDEDD
jgi:serine/threonine protein kinase